MQTKRIQRKKKKLTASERVIYGILLILALIVLFPVIYIISLSFSDTGAVSRGEVVLLPVGFNLDAYKYVLQDARFGRYKLYYLCGRKCTCIRYLYRNDCISIVGRDFFTAKSIYGSLDDHDVFWWRNDSDLYGYQKFTSVK